MLASVTSEDGKALEQSAGEDGTVGHLQRRSVGATQISVQTQEATCCLLSHWRGGLGLPLWPCHRLIWDLLICDLTPNLHLDSHLLSL